MADPRGAILRTSAGPSRRAPCGILGDRMRPAASEGAMDGGDLVARTLVAHRVEHLFTLCGGHISPILVGAKRRGIRVVDVRHEADAVFAADAVARLTGRPGVAAVTAGPGVTNTITAVKNAQLAQSPVLLLGGATATLLKGRGALQDIDQMALIAPHVKWAAVAERVRDLPEAVATALRVAAAGVPGPVFVECPVDLLYPRRLVAEWYGAAGSGKSLAGRALGWYLRRHVRRLFRGADRWEEREIAAPHAIEPLAPGRHRVTRVAARLRRARRPVLVDRQPGDAPRRRSRAGGVGRPPGRRRRRPRRPHLPGQHRPRPARRRPPAAAPPRPGQGAARGRPGHPRRLPGRLPPRLRPPDLAPGHPDRRQPERRADEPQPPPRPRRARRSRAVPRRPRRGDGPRRRRGAAGAGAPAGGGPWGEWLATLRGRDDEREAEIERLAAAPSERVNPLRLCREIDRAMGDDAVLVADGGDFVATASYTVRPRGPLGWLDPGAFGTLGVGGGFALGAKLCRPRAEVWVLYGDGSVAYSLAEFDAFARHGLPVIAVVGNDAGWTQIAREQVPILGDDVGTTLARTDYHLVGRGVRRQGAAPRPPRAHRRGARRGPPPRRGRPPGAGQRPAVAERVPQGLDLDVASIERSTLEVENAPRDPRAPRRPDPRRRPSPRPRAAAADTHPFTVHDLVAMERISDPRVSPDGTRGGLRPALDRPGGQQGSEGPLAGRSRRRRPAAADPRRRRRRRPAVVARRRLDLLPVHSAPGRSRCGGSRSPAARPSR